MIRVRLRGGPFEGEREIDRIIDPLRLDNEVYQHVGPVTDGVDEYVWLNPDPNAPASSI